MMRSSVAMLTVALLWAASADAVPSLVTDSSGRLLGAKNVEVNGSLFHVEFLDGTCASVFGTCAVSSFPFSTLGAAESASTALLAQIFDPPNTLYDDEASLTNGCGPEDSVDACNILTPYLVNVGTVFYVRAVNVEPVVPDFIDASASPLSFDTSGPTVVTWARWAPAEQGRVPEPSAVAFLAAGCLVLVSRKRTGTRSGSKR